MFRPSLISAAHSSHTERGVHTTIVLYLTVTVVMLVIVFGSLFVALHSSNAQSQDPDQLRNLIVDRNKRLLELRDEIDKYQKELAEVSSERQTLESTIKTLDISRNKLSSEIELTTEQIERTDLQLRQLDIAIRETELLIERDAEIISDSLRKIDELDTQTLIEALLTNQNLADFWDEVSETMSFQEAIQANLKQIQERKTRMEDSMTESEKAKMQLSGLQQELAGEQEAILANRKEKDRILKVTANQEEEYQRQLQTRIAARDQFLAELRQFESQLDFILNPSTIPSAGTGVLSWPFDPTYMTSCPSFASALGNSQCVTQHFGNTAFAQSGAYNGSGHNGVDFRAPPGTRILSALAGTVVGIGNTDAVAGCYSYGKWVLVRHNNGLTSLYAHLSSIGVNQGQTVATGELLGHSGSTGYSTGPHLHFAVFASEGVKVQRLGDIPGRPITGCSPASIPVAGFEAYLNPLNYL